MAHILLQHKPHINHLLASMYKHKRLNLKTHLFFWKAGPTNVRFQHNQRGFVPFQRWLPLGLLTAVKAPPVKVPLVKSSMGRWGVWNSRRAAATPRKINMEPKNHPFRKENDHANTSQDYSSGMVAIIFPDNSCGHKIKKKNFSVNHFELHHPVDSAQERIAGHVICNNILYKVGPY